MNELLPEDKDQLEAIEAALEEIEAMERELIARFEALMRLAEPLYSRNRALPLDRFRTGILREPWRTQLLLDIQINRDFDVESKYRSLNMDDFIKRMFFKYWYHFQFLRVATPDSPARLRVTAELKQRLAARAAVAQERRAGRAAGVMVSGKCVQGRW
jgi:hypothetical protein